MMMMVINNYVIIPCNSIFKAFIKHIDTQLKKKEYRNSSMSFEIGQNGRERIGSDIQNKTSVDNVSSCVTLRVTLNFS